MEVRMGEKYVAYVGSYTHGKAKGITICDMDAENGILTAREEIEVGNPSYMCISTSGKYLYSVADFGIRSFEIMEDGSLKYINDATINGMRACHVTVDLTDHYIFTAGYHDGKVTVLSINPDGSVGKVKSEVFHKGMGSIAERTFRPHITCATLTPDQKFLVTCDVGTDQVKIYKFNYAKGTIQLIDLLRCELESAPRSMIFSPDGKFAYMICQLKNYVEVYSYDGSENMPRFTLIERVPTVGAKVSKVTAVAAIKMTLDGKHLFCTNAGDNSVAFYNRDEQTGRLTMLNVLPISGDYPKEMMVFPDGKHVASLNHTSGTITFFTVDYDKGLLIMHGKPLETEMPNCCIYKKLS